MIRALAERRIGQEIQAAQQRGELKSRGGAGGRVKVDGVDFDPNRKLIGLADLDISKIRVERRQILRELRAIREALEDD